MIRWVLLLILLTGCEKMKLFKAQNKPASINLDTLLIVFTGESNSRGLALNSESDSGDLGTRSEIKIYNPTTGTIQTMVIDPVTFGVSNNRIDNAGDENNSQHGMEIGLANAVRDNSLDYSEVYLVKAGQGGSRISEWSVGGSYYNTLLSRVDYVIGQLDAAGKTYRIVFWYSQGINDITNGLSSASWKTSTEAVFTGFRSEYGSNLPIIMTKFMTGYTGYNSTIDDIASGDAYTEAVDVTGASVNDPIIDPVHWDAAGFLTLVPRMVTATKIFL
jgi:hypothetical protein